jgi:glycosyltransferase involved in cell wall biosynthesis
MILANPTSSNTQLSCANPRVCVIIPAYNTAPFIAEALESVFAQTYTNLEVIVVNDRSPDTPQLEHVLAPFRDRIRYIRKENTGGVAAARNTAIQVTNAELIALLDSDDVWPSDSLAIQVDELIRRGADVIYGDGIIFGAGCCGTEFRFSQFCPSRGTVTFESILSRECNVLVSVVARREAILNIGMFNERLRRCEDFDLWCRIAKAGYRISYHSKPVLRYRRHEQSLSANPFEMIGTMVELLESYRRFDLTPAERRAVETQIEFCQAETLFRQGKNAFVSSEFAVAVTLLRAANDVLQNRRLTTVIFLIRFIPAPVRWAYATWYPAICQWIARIRNARVISHESASASTLKHSR